MDPHDHDGFWALVAFIATLGAAITYISLQNDIEEKERKERRR